MPYPERTTVRSPPPGRHAIPRRGAKSLELVETRVEGNWKSRAKPTDPANPAAAARPGRLGTYWSSARINLPKAGLNAPQWPYFSEIGVVNS